MRRRVGLNYIRDRRNLVDRNFLAYSVASTECFTFHSNVIFLHLRLADPGNQRVATRRAISCQDSP